MRSLPSANPPLRFRAGEALAFDGDASVVVDVQSASGRADTSLVLDGSMTWTKCAAIIAAHAEELNRLKDLIRGAEEFAAALKPAVLRAVLEVVMTMEAAVLHTISEPKRGTVLQGLSATSKGLVVPYSWYGQVLKAAEECVSGLYARHVLRREPIIDLTRLSGQIPALNVDCSEEVPAQCGELVTPFQEASTAVRVALVWRMLEQLSGTVPGASAALHAFKGILPCVYHGFEKVGNTLPPVTNLAAQIEQLAALPTTSGLLQSRTVDAEQLAHDTHYVRSGMQNWAFQIWYQQLLAAKRKDKFLSRIEDVLARSHRKSRLRTVMVAWRRYTSESKTAERFRLMRERVAENTKSMAKRPAVHESLTASHIETSKATDSATTLAKLVHGLVQDRRDDEASRLAKLEEGNDGAAPATAAAAAPDLAMTLDDFLTSPEILAMETDTVATVRQLDLVAEVCRSQLDTQREEIRRLTKDRDRLQLKATTLENKVLEAVQRATTVKNELDRTSIELTEAKREVTRLRSRITLQEHHAWRVAALDATRRVAMVNEEDPLQTATDAINTATRSAVGMSNGAGGESQGIQLTVPPAAALAQQQPTATPTDIVLRDWVNSCLSDLVSIEKGALGGGSGGGVRGSRSTGYAGRGVASMLQQAQSLRASTLDDEFRDGVLFSRLVYYLCLPRYRSEGCPASTVDDAASATTTVTDDVDSPSRNRRGTSFHRASSFGGGTLVSESSEAVSFSAGPPEVNRQLLFSKDPRVTLNPLYPRYQFAFADFATLPRVKRMEILLEGIMQLLGTEMTALFDAAQLTEGFYFSIKLLLSLLYVRFAHPLQHKTAADAANERTGADLGLAGILPPLSSSGSRSHCLQGKFWSPAFIETSDDLSGFMHFFVDQQQSLDRYKWSVVRDAVLGTLSNLAARTDGGADRTLLRAGYDVVAFRAMALPLIQSLWAEERKVEAAELEAAKQLISLPSDGGVNTTINMEESISAVTALEALHVKREQERAASTADILRVLATFHTDLVTAFANTATQQEGANGHKMLGLTVQDWRNALRIGFLAPQRISIAEAMDVFYWANPTAREAMTSGAQIHGPANMPAWARFGGGGGGGGAGSRSGSVFAAPALEPHRPSGVFLGPGPLPHMGRRNTVSPNVIPPRRLSRASIVAPSTVAAESGDAAESVNASVNARAAPSGVTTSIPTPSAIDPSHLMSFAEFVTAFLRLAHLWTATGPGSHLNSPLSSAATLSFDRARPQSMVIVPGVSAAPSFDTVPAALEFILAGHVSMIANRGGYDAFLEQLHSAAAQKVVQARLLDIHSLFTAYGRLYAEDYGMDVNQFIRSLKDAAVLSQDFPAVAAQQLFQQVVDHEIALRKNVEALRVDTTMTFLSPTLLYGTAALSSLTDEAKTTSPQLRRASSVAGGGGMEAELEQVKLMRLRALKQRTGAGTGAAASLSATVNVFRLHNFVQALAVLAVQRTPSPFTTMPEKLEGFLKAFIDTLRPKAAQAVKMRLGGGIAVPIPRGGVAAPATPQPPPA